MTSLDQPALHIPLQFLKGVGPRRAAELEKSGLRTLEDLLLRLPIRYENRGRLQPIASLKLGDVTSVRGQIKGCYLRPTRRPGFRIFEILVEDASGAVRVVFLNQPFLKNVLVSRQQVMLFGKVEVRRSGGLQLANPEWEILSDSEHGELIHTGCIVPVYERAGSVTSKMLRRIVHAGLQRLPDPLEDQLPQAVRREHGLLGRRAALVGAHFPASGVSIDKLNQFLAPAQRRLIFEEFFLFQLGLVLRRREADSVRKKSRTIQLNDRIRRAALNVLPFRLTNDQKRALKEIVDDLQRPCPMNRLLQGDVGVGKTIVALLAALVAMENGLQVAVMSPTEILAEQHYLNLERLLRPSRFEAILLTGALGVKARREAWDRLASGSAHLAVGTQALIQDAVRFKDLGLVIIDEQHRFGVLQRATLREKGFNPDVLVMTATPIPRTLALTAYGDLDVSVIRDLPPGRQPIETRLQTEGCRPQVYDFIHKQLDNGRQVYVVCPLVEESAKHDLKAATEMSEHLARDVFPGYRVALVHGRMKAAQREEIMQAFATGEINLLVATTVVEVGVDVPNASVMLIEHAERFGLAQLHQLRGRVGRGAHQSRCVLLHQTPLGVIARSRLEAVVATTDGFEIAERDLELRGPGDFFGTRQSGVPILRVGDLLRDKQLMEGAREAALNWLDSGGASASVLASVRAGWAERFGLAGVG